MMFISRRKKVRDNIFHTEDCEATHVDLYLNNFKLFSIARDKSYMKYLTSHESTSVNNTYPFEKESS